MTAAEATPRPWTAEVYAAHPANAYIVGMVPKGRPSGEVIVQCHPTVANLRNVDNAANAALIVRAVNAHDDLVAALHELVSLIPTKFSTQPAFDNARALLREIDDAK